MPDPHPTARIHRTAIVEEGATLGAEVTIGPYAFVGPYATIGAGSRLDQGAIVQGDTVLGEGNHLFPYVVLGSIPQDKKYGGERAHLEIGDRNVIREHVTVHIGTEGGGGVTRIGSDNLLMAGAHVGHDCQVGNHCVLANFTGLAGHVSVGDHAILGGHTGVHQFVRIGQHCMAGGGSKVGQDIPPFTIAQGYPARIRGINHIGLRRRGFSDDTIKALRQAYRKLFYGAEAVFSDTIARVREEFAKQDEVSALLDFLTEAYRSGRGFMRPPPKEVESDSSVKAQPSEAT